MTWRIETWGTPMTFQKLTQAIGVTSALWLKLLPVLRDIVEHYDEIVNGDDLQSEEDRDRGRALVARLNKVLEGREGR